jgi:hypothetical protein
MSAFSEGNFGLKIAPFYKKGHFRPEGGCAPLHPPPGSARGEHCVAYNTARARGNILVYT